MEMEEKIGGKGDLNKAPGRGGEISGPVISAKEMKEL